MGAYVCTVAGGKGGVGRTTTAVNLGCALQADGYDTVIVDADLGMSNVAATLGLDPETAIHDVLDDSASLDEALVERDSGLTLLPGRRELEAYARADPSELRAVVDILRTRYDIVLVDVSAGISRETAVPLRFSDGVILVTTPNRISLSDTAKTSQLAASLGGDVLGSIVTRLTDADQLWDVREYLDVPTLGVIPNEDQISDTDDPITTTETPAGQAYTALAGNLARIIFDDEDPLDIEPVFEEWWVADEDEESTEDETAGADDDEDDENGGGRFSLFG
jgi:septum site-determining protein MinD